jgi:DnaJ-class molecular chaperone
MHAFVIFLLILAFAAQISCNDFFGGNPFQGAFYGTSSNNQRNRQDTKLYDLLGLDPSCSADDIKRAYRRQARATHPDKGGDTEQFKQVNAAYEVLSDDQKRAIYDRHGEAGLDPHSNANNHHNQFSSASDFAREFFKGFGGSGFPGAAFGGGSMFSMPMVFQLDLSLEDFYKGRELIIPIQSIRVNVNIQPGMIAGQELILKGQFQDERGAPRDLIFRLRELRHDRFRRKNADLLTEVTLTLKEAIFGFQRQLTLLDGSTVLLKSRKGEGVVKHGDCLMVEGLGMPIYQSVSPTKADPHDSFGSSNRGRGRLFVVVTVDMPTGSVASVMKERANRDELQRLLGVLDGSVNEKDNKHIWSQKEREKEKGDERASVSAASADANNNHGSGPKPSPPPSSSSSSSSSKSIKKNMHGSSDKEGRAGDSDIDDSIGGGNIVAVEAQRSDIGYFGNYGAVYEEEEEEEEEEGRFGHFFFR